MSCCNIVALLAAASQFSLLRHSLLLALSATGGARKRPHFDTCPYISTHRFQCVSRKKDEKKTKY